MNSMDKINQLTKNDFISLFEMFLKKQPGLQKKYLPLNPLKILINCLKNF